MMRLTRILTMPDYRMNLLARLDHALHQRRYCGLLAQPGNMVQKGFVQAMSDACEFLQIETDEFFHLADTWPEMERALFQEAGKGEKFYSSWRDEYARANICANILSQHHDQINFSVLLGLLEKGIIPDGPWVDYGCGTASLTITLAREGVVTGPVSLVEMDNGIMDFVRFRLAKHRLDNALKLHSVDHFEAFGKNAMVYCIDVLEHLLDPTAVFLEKVDPLVAVGGLLYLKAPWRGQLTHLEEAPVNFYRQGGRRALSRRYEKVLRAQAMDVAAVFRKLRDAGGAV